ncbi:MoaD/ThiS family protein [Pelagicoccus sp. SDUM812003]|uniref:MoaD/ThiS family protein n=1 Tax=Pelagicoccus sp. SDUM812003 TaxID=3041267 RepID=UPI00280C9E51|nr:MoaD/ThiS family protein [Pelagicoccus sp. SDUM812003]MDQ8202315.1 MoaD/ThiS family protein [Pelagicoccus sp. SDUM812003]
MPKLCFTSNLQRHVESSDLIVDASRVVDALEVAFAKRPRLRGYILDDQGCLHRHMAILVNGVAIRDREKLETPVRPDDEIFVVQALSGG